MVVVVVVVCAIGSVDVVETVVLGAGTVVVVETATVVVLVVAGASAPWTTEKLNSPPANRASEVRRRIGVPPYWCLFHQ
jgi:hypothetical protein